MRLQALKLAGFKSFVEPTQLLFPSNLVGIVGPNGCGKSNTIDAVRWVMGESSAKNLRGEQSDDVIFNGSTNRRAISQAAVELIFNNQSGRLGGEFAAYQEVSIRREISRDGESRYFLNSQRCRKRDISDLLLGTGLGPRSYAIIEQGMISRFIEAKPEELRLYLEEAAGISKYKERRRESENHLRQTEAHLLRLRDLKNELEQRVIHLEAQAEQAKRHEALQQEQATAEQNILGLRFLLLQQQYQQLSTQKDLQKTIVQDLSTALESLEREQETLQETQAVGQESLLQQQANLSRLQQKLQHLEQKLRQEQTKNRDAQQRQRYQQERLEVIENEIKSLTEKQQAFHLTQALSPSDNPFGEAKIALQQQCQALEHQLREAKAKQSLWQETALSIDQAIHRLQQQKQQLEKRRQRLAERQQESPFYEKQAQVIKLQQEQAEVSNEKGVNQQEIQELINAITKVKNALLEVNPLLQEKEQALQNLEQRQQTLRNHLALLEPKEDGAWLQDLGFNSETRLAEVIEIKDLHWQNALAQLLSAKRRAILLPQLRRLPPAPPPGAAYYLQLKNPDPTTSTAASINDAGLWQKHWQDKIVINKWLSPWLAQAIPIENLETAWAQRTALPAHNFYIDPKGRCLGRDWCYFPGQEASHWFDLQEEVKQITPKLAPLQQHCQNLAERRDAYHTELLHLEELFSKKNQQQQALEKILWQNRSQQENLEQTLLFYQKQAQERNAEAEDLDAESAAIHEELLEHQQRKSDWQKNQSQVLSEQQSQQQTVNALRERLQQLENQWQKHEQTQQQVLIAQAEQRSQQQAITEQLEKLSREKASILQEKKDIAKNQADLKPLLDSLEEEIAELLEEKQQEEGLMRDVQRLQNQQQQQWQALEKKKNQHWQELQKEQQLLQNIDLQNERLRERESLILEQWPSVASLPETLQHLATTHPDTASQEKFLKIYEKKQKELQQALAALGLVNLAAIAEFAEQKSRFDYLATQEADISKSFQELNSAIAKLDTETSERFQKIFTAVDSRLRERFPRLFGGGEAYLELTGDNLLDTGIRIMARPPGKKLSSIHLMSGGEKALTAIAIVFSIFELNPAPFCLLDEVDAPLDETNVGRFCAMVEEMSAQVQFIFISHNKRTMAMAKQLLGVTMREPGISRLVSVDLAQALSIRA